MATCALCLSFWRWTCKFLIGSVVCTLLFAYTYWRVKWLEKSWNSHSCNGYISRVWVPACCWEYCKWAFYIWAETNLQLWASTGWWETFLVANSFFKFRYLVNKLSATNLLATYTSSSSVSALEACQSWSLLWCIVNDARVSSLSARYELLRTNSLKGLSLMLVRMFTKQVRICPLELNASYLLDWGATLTWSAWFGLNTWSHVWSLVLDKLCVFMRGL